MTGGGWTSLIIIGVLAGFLATNLRVGNRLMPGGWIVGIIAGLVGAYIGGVVLGAWGWMLGGLNVVGGIIGGLVIAYAVEFFGPRASVPR